MIGKINPRGMLHGPNQIYFESNYFNVFSMKNGEKLGHEFKKIWLYQDCDKDTGKAIMTEKFEMMKWTKLITRSDTKTKQQRQVIIKVLIYEMKFNQ